MYQVGDIVIYGNSGACRVVSVGVPQATWTDRHKMYYTLSPIYGSETIYVPVDAKVFMRPVLSKNEAQALIEKIPAIRDENDRGAHPTPSSENYLLPFKTHNCCDLIRLIQTIYHKNQLLRSAGRKPGKVDERYRKRAEELLYGELAVALDIPKENVPQYIQHVLEPHA